MEQRQCTIDQHFRVRKRKHASPEKSSGFKVNRDVLYEERLDESPIKKGSLESFVVISKRRDSLGAGHVPVSQPVKISNKGLISTAGVSETGEGFIGLVSPDSRISPTAHGPLKYDESTGVPKVEGKSHGVRFRKGVGELDAAKLAAGNASFEVCNGVALNYGERRASSPGIGAVYRRRKQKAEPEIDDSEAPQLTQFASDFLSNFFSVVTSADPPKSETPSAQNFSRKRKERLELDDATTEKKPCHYSRLSEGGQNLHCEEETESIAEQLLITRIGSSDEDSEEQQSTRLLEGGEVSEEFLSLTDSQSVCASPIELKTGSETRVRGTPPDLVLTEVLSLERGHEAKACDEVGNSSGSKVNTPAVNLKANFQPNSLEGRRLHTPQTLLKGPSHLNASGGVYRSSLFSPGDDFWDEAIEVAGSLLASKIVVAASTPSQRGLCSQVQEGEFQDKKTGSSGIILSSKAGVECDKVLATAKLTVLDAADVETRHAANSNIHDKLRMLTEAKDTSAVSKVNGTSVSKVPEQVKDLKLHTRSFEGFSKTVKDGRVGGWLKHLGAKAASPLPVRHFDFSGSKEIHDLEDFPAPYKEVEGVAQIAFNDRPLGLNDEQKIAPLEYCQDIPMVEDHVGPGDVRLDTKVENGSKSLKRSNRSSHLYISEEAQRQDNVHILAPSERSDRRPVTTTPESSFGRALQEKSMELNAWLPQEVANVYAKKGLKHLYPWQMECLQIDGVLEGKNLIYSASTSAGKSLVAELLMIKRIIATGRIALFVLPFVSICSEKAEHLEAVMEPLGKRVGCYFGTQGSATLPRDTSIAVCTIEKANSLVNKLLEEGRLPEIAMIVIDELHMVGDRERGYLLELLLTKIRFACGEIDNIHDGSQEGVAVRSSPFQRNSKGDLRTDLQIVGMSATMPNIAAVSHWLQASLYVTDFRPVPLEEYLKVGSALYNKNMEIVRHIRKGADFGGKDPDHVVELCHEVVSEGNSVLVFCSSRKACETSALHIAKFLPPFSPAQRGASNGFTSGAEAVEELRKSASGLDPVLAITLPAGVAYHHAGLTMEEREVVEQCFKQGVVRVLTATSTLAAGVNLPARRVIFRQPKVGRDFLDGTRYRQMAGRAGRAGIDTKGESVLICKPEEVKRMTNVITSGCEPLHSCLTNDKIGMMRALLEVVAGGMVQTPQDVHRYVRCTLLNSTESFDHVVKGVQDALRWLCSKKFLEWCSETEMYSTTPLGRAAFGSSLTPEESLIVFEDLAKAREGFVLASDLHLVYQVTPIYVELEPDWSLFYSKFVELSHLEQAVGNRVGVMEPFLMRMAHGAPVQSGSRLKGSGKSPKARVGLISPHNYGGRQLSMDNVLRVCRRFYVALMLSKLVQELPLMEVSDSFKVPRGTVQALQASAGRFAAMVSGFCQRLGWHDLEGLVSKFQSRVSFGVKSEIVELTEIPFVKGSRARGLYKAGLRTIQAVAEASMPELVKALIDATPWVAQDESRRMVQQRVLKGLARKIKYGAQRIVVDRAEEARIAAFSAMRALGVDVPSLSVPVKMVAPSNVDEDEVRDEAETERSHPPPQVQPVADGDQGNGNLQISGSVSVVGAQTLRRDGIGSQLAAPVDVDLSIKKMLAQDNKEKEGTCIDMEDTISIKKTMLSTANVEPVIQKFKETVFMDASSRPFGGADIFKERSPKKASDEPQIATGKVLSGPVDVDKMDGGFDRFFQTWLGVEEFVFDLNYKNHSTDSLEEEFEIVGIAICWEGSPVYYVHLSDIVPNNSLNDGTSAFQRGETTKIGMQTEMHMIRWDKVGSMLCRNSLRKITWNLKDQFRALQSPVVSAAAEKVDSLRVATVFGNKLGDCEFFKMPPLKLLEPYFDVRIAAWLLWPDEESSHTLTLEQEVKKRLSGEVAAIASRAGRWSNQMGRVSHNGCCRRAAQTRALHSALWKLLVSEGLNHPLSMIEMPLVRVLAAMETSGVGIDMDACSRTRQVLEERLKELEARAHHLAGKAFSLSLPADVANVLYKHLKLPVPAGCPAGKHHPSTNKHALELLKEQHPVAAVIQEHRKLSKLLHSTLGSIITWAKSPHTLGSSGHVHQIFGRWLHTSTATGRLAMEEPNLQCVENTICLIEDQGFQPSIDGATNSPVEIKARELFVPTQGWVLLSADYSQIEVRLMAHFAEDAAMIDLLSRPSGDLFRLIAAQWTGQEEDTVSIKQREQTKRLVYGILYGMGVHTLAEHLDASVAEASVYLDRFKAAFPGLSAWLNQALINCRQKGYVVTLGGRKRFLEKINTGSYSEQARAGRQSANTICQGSAADLIKMAMIKLHSAIYGDEASSCIKKSNTAEGNPSDIKGRCRLLLQIHDELVLEVERTALKEVSEVVRSCMEGVVKLKVPLRVKIQVGSNWGALKPLEI
ncbi:DNA polymerase theta [Marchantia polymorpha subsp. ruderalis]|uniref:DNA-directed DNA polymerase n=2 Tax=Marchantia polymorpha TaxID=3197 RepID=A0AAF6BP14_MARPO|nr:hypothetical protein MARPO_0097s0045 [Marchantia polymorpha]BBN13748.1 hypothetical protein Mp_6g05990 [Marchantia polymorpha subsp. ruderalis]|eukprot:PTQ32567.1 hypothetical protein MARPO_0097s0045 [Marchantia polymorpha]